MPLPTNAADDCLHRYNCCEAFMKTPPKAWEFLFYIPNHHHPIQDDEGLSSHFCLVLPDDYKQSLMMTCTHNSSSSSSSSSSTAAAQEDYRAVALITRKPRFSTRHKGYRVFKPHTARCTCAQTSSTAMETNVFDRVNSTTVESPCHLYNRLDKRNKGHFETWSWFTNSVIPIQAPKMVHVNCLHLLRPLTQPRMGVTLHASSLASLDDALRQFKEIPSGMPLMSGEMVTLEDALQKLKAGSKTQELGLVGRRKRSLKQLLGRDEVTREAGSPVEKRTCSIKRMLGCHEVTRT
ncbi:MAG: hypothetical protein Q9168_003791 [Polycauliona sp. 1 TL-2023]